MTSLADLLARQEALAAAQAAIQLRQIQILTSSPLSGETYPPRISTPLRTADV